MPLQVFDGDILAFEARSRHVTTSKSCKGKEAPNVHQQPLCSNHTTATLSGTAGKTADVDVLCCEGFASAWPFAGKVDVRQCR